MIKEDWEYFKLMSEDGDLYVNCVDSTFEGCYEDSINLANAIHDKVDLHRRIEVTERELFIYESCKRCNWDPDSAAGSMVGDMFMGSGTTGIVACNTGRKFVGVELDEDFYNLSKNRILKLDNNQ